MIELKTAFVLLFVLGLLPMSRLLLPEVSVNASSGLLYVDLNNTLGPWNGTLEYPYRNITNALENALDGDTIFVRSGTYNEYLVLNISVSLVGEDASRTVIDGFGAGTMIYVTADNVTISGFTIQNSGTGIEDSAVRLESSSGAVVDGNVIVSNNIGVLLSSSSRNAISNNVISNNYFGITFSFSMYNTVLDNVLESNKLYGISVHYSSARNVFSGNHVSFSKNGVDLDAYSSSNTFYHNDFSNNTKQVASASANFWDYNGEGNYWSDYAGQNRGDGIGRTRYVIESVFGNVDNDPLMGVFSDFNVALLGKAYNVTVVSNSTVSDFTFEIGPETGNRITLFNVTTISGTFGFCRVAIPMALMNYSLIVSVDGQDITPTMLSMPDLANRYLYFTYPDGLSTVRIVSSQELDMYKQLLDEFLAMNATYYNLLHDYTTQLQTGLGTLNATYLSLLREYNNLLGNYSQLQQSYSYLNASYYDVLANDGQNSQNMRNLGYILAATTGVFLIITIYLSKRSHASAVMSTETVEER